MENTHEIEFKGKKYEIRTISYKNGLVNVANVSLANAILTPEYNYVNKEAMLIDDSILFYLNDEQMKLSDKQIIQIINI